MKKHEFQVGDTVKVLRNKWSVAPEGSIGVVATLFGPGYGCTVKFENDEDNWCYDYEDLQLVVLAQIQGRWTGSEDQPQTLPREFVSGTPLREKPPAQPDSIAYTNSLLEKVLDELKAIRENTRK